MYDLKAFREANGLTQDELGAYLGIGKSHISMIEHGKAKLNTEKFNKLLNNPNNWDTSMLVEEATSNALFLPAYDNPVKGMIELAKENAMLREQIEELKKEKERYWEMITRLTAR